MKEGPDRAPFPLWQQLIAGGQHEPKTWTAVDDYIAERLLPADPVLEAALANNDANGLPAIDVSPAQGKLLNLLVRMSGARTILEIGTLGGYSTIWLARALPPGGKVVTLELEPHHAEVARINFDRAGLSGLVDLRVGPALELAAGAARRGRRAVRLHLHRRRQAEQPALPVVGAAAVAAGHGHRLRQRHPRRRGARTRTAAMPTSKARARRSRSSAARARLDGTAIQTVGAKGYDGFAIAIVG